MRSLRWLLCRAAIWLGILVALEPAARGAIGIADGLVSRVVVLSIHVVDAETHGRVLRFLTEDLGFPVDYGPEIHGQRHYAAVYAGNLFLEPCGPFPGALYHTNRFQALFYGMNCRSDRGAESVERALTASGVGFSRDGEVFVLREAPLVEHMHWSVDCRTREAGSALNEETLRRKLADTQESGPGVRRVREIRVSCRDESDLHVWSRVLGRPEMREGAVWSPGGNLRIRLVREGVRGVMGIDLEVDSVDRAMRHLGARRISTRPVPGGIELDPAKACGLSVRLIDRDSQPGSRQ